MISCLSTIPKVSDILFVRSVIRDSELEESNKTEIVDDLLKNIYVHNKNISKIYENSEECISSSSENTINQNETYGYQRVLKK